MNFSKFVHLYDVENDMIAVYHSLLVRTIFLTKQEKYGVDLYLKEGIVINDEIKNVINYLYSNYYIVESVDDDMDLKKQCVDMIQDPAISNAYIVVTENCNFNCKYCFISETISKNNKEKIMTEDVARKSVELLQRTYERQQHEYDKTITFYGGEPLLNFDIIKFFIEEVEQIKKSKYWPQDVKYALISNGALLTKEHINYFKEKQIALSISYDIDKHSHSNRISKKGEDTYDIVRDNIQLCIDENMPYSLSITVSEDTIKNKDYILNEIANLNPITVAFNMLIPNKHLIIHDNYYERVTDFMIECFEQLRTKGIYEDRIMRKVQSFVDNKLYLYDCCASGGNQYVISSNGQIGICHGYLNNRKYFTSTVFDDTFDFRDNIDFNYWKKRSPLFILECQDCECLGICGGGCPYAADYKHGSIYAMDDRFCIHAKKILKWLINDLYKQSKVTNYE